MRNRRDPTRSMKATPVTRQRDPFEMSKLQSCPGGRRGNGVEPTVLTVGIHSPILMRPGGTPEGIVASGSNVDSCIRRTREGHPVLKPFQGLPLNLTFLTHG